MNSRLGRRISKSRLTAIGLEAECLLSDNLPAKPDFPLLAQLQTYYFGQKIE